MKILIINTVEYAYNGITAVIRNYYQNMDLTGLQVDFVTWNEPVKELRDEIEQRGGTIYILPRKKIFTYMSSLFLLAKREKYQAAHVHGNSATMSFELIPLMLAGVQKRIVSSHNTTCGHMRLHKLLYPIFIHSYTDAIACGKEAGEWLFHDRPFKILKNGIAVYNYEFQPEIRMKKRRELGFSDTDYVAGHVGLFNEQKNQAFLVELMKHREETQRNIKLLMVGTGSNLEKIKQEVKAAGLQQDIVFAGETNRVQDFLQAMDCFMLPSLFEGLPVALIEAQASGLPCFVSDFVTTESDLTGQVNFLSLDESKRDEWHEKISEQSAYDRKSTSENAIEAIIENGYFIGKNARDLEEIYLK